MLKKFIEDRQLKFNSSADFFNDLVTKNIKPFVNDKRKQRRLTEIDIKKTQNIINNLVEHSGENHDGLSNNFDWNAIDFFINVWKEFFIQIDISNRKVKRDSWSDLFNLVYVGPDDLYWTKDNGVKKLIEAAKMEKHLFSI